MPARLCRDDVRQSQMMVVSPKMCCLIFHGRGAVKKNAESSVLPQRNSYFVSRELRAKVSFPASSTKFSKLVEDIACDAFAPESSIRVLPKFREVLSAVFV